MSLLRIIFETLWFFLPAMVANMAPVFAAKYDVLPSLNRPLDLGLTWNKVAILGQNKTVRGLVVGLCAGLIVGFLQGAPLVGMALGFGALMGDAVKSLLKRRKNLPSGKSWKPWDQIDFVIGAIIVSIFFAPLTYKHYLVALVMVGIGSYVVSYIGVKIGIKKQI